MTKIRGFISSRNVAYTLCIVAGILSIALRFPEPEKQTYINADVTWYSLLTMRAYSETPAAIHKFLPIVSLGGTTIPDRYGNYYYTSFSALGYFVPYAFVRVFNLPFNERSLYVFNSALYLLSFILTAMLMVKLFGRKLPEPLVAVISALYLFQPEILHSQGLVYWHQSLFQAVFLLQLLLFADLRGKWRHTAFFALCLIAPYLEWTGYIGNIGFAVAFFFEKGITISRDIVSIKTGKLLKAVSVAALTTVSFTLFAIHYLLAVDKGAFFGALKSRFTARAFIAGVY